MALVRRTHRKLCKNHMTIDLAYHMRCKMADGDDRDEDHSHNQKGDPEPPVPFENLQIDEEAESDLEEEYLYLDGQLDRLGVCLEQMESRSDSLLNKLKSMIEAQLSQASEKEKNGTDEKDERSEDGSDGMGTDEGACKS